MSRKSAFDRLVANPDQGDVFGSDQAKNKGVRDGRLNLKVDWAKTMKASTIPKSGPSILICGNCLKSDHHKSACYNRVYCRICHRPGHISYYYNNKQISRGFVPKQRPRDCFVKDWGSINFRNWFKNTSPLTDGPGTSAPPQYVSFGEVDKFFVVRESEATLGFTEQNLQLCLAPQVLPVFVLIPQEEPILVPSQPSSPQASSPSISMAYQRADPAPFMPHGFNHLQIQGRDHRVRAVIGRHPPIHEDWAIATIDPMPLNEVPFENINGAIREFLV